MSKHIHGPWHVDDFVNTDELEIGTADGAVIGTAYPFDSDEVGEGIQKANANLIAAAPELLEALIKVQRAIACWRDDEPIPGGLNLEEVKYCIVDPAIAKAEGGGA